MRAGTGVSGWWRVLLTGGDLSRAGLREGDSVLAVGIRNKEAFSLVPVDVSSF